MSFPTWSHKGSSCYHDVSLGHLSVKDQYCNLETGNWHETVYVGSEDCAAKKNWWTHTIEPVDLTFTTDSCIGGYRLVNCHKGPCHQEDDTAINIEAEAMAKVALLNVEAEEWAM